MSRIHDTKLSDDEAPFLEFGGMWSSPSPSLLPGPLWLGMVVPVGVPSMGQIELFDIHETIKQISSNSFNNKVSDKLFK